MNKCTSKLGDLHRQRRVENKKRFSNCFINFLLAAQADEYGHEPPQGRAAEDARACFHEAAGNKR